MAVARDPFAAWSGFFTGMLGALGALTGLLFVAISNNLEEILKIPSIVGRAAQALWTMVALLIICGVSLTPQRTDPVGIEIVVIAGLMLLMQTPHHLHGIRDDFPDRWRWAVSRIVATVPSLTLVAVGGVLLTGGRVSGLYWVAGGVVVGVVGVTYSAWVLLVEVLRRTR